MNSPDIDLLERIIRVNRDDDTSLYLQLAQQIVHAIQRGYLPLGSKLPGTRSIASKFGLHRKTVVAAYDELSAQGWIEILPNKGSFIIQPKSSYSKFHKHKITKLNQGTESNDNHTIDIVDNIILHLHEEDSNLPYQLSDGKIDLRQVNIKQIVHYYSAIAKRKYVWNNISKGHTTLKSHFIDQVCSYLNLTRGLHIPQKNICTSTQKQSIRYATIRAIIRPADIVVVADISDYKVNMTFAQCGAKLRTIPLDDYGISVEALEQILQHHPIRAVYVQAQHHYPTTTTLSTIRRMKLLALASQFGFIIIEDDEYIEFSYDKNHPMSMAASDTKSSVIYLSTLGSHLPDSYQTAFVIASSAVIQQISNQLKLIQTNSDMLILLSLTEMISEGEIHRSLKKNMLVYTQRRNHMCSEIIKKLGAHVSIAVPRNGLAVWISLSNEISLIQLKKLCAKQGLHIPKNILYQSKNITGIRWGFAEHTEEEIDKHIHIFSECLLQIVQ